MESDSEKIKVSRIIPRPDKPRVVRAESNLPVFSRMLKSSAINFLHREIAKHNNLDGEVKSAYKVGESVLDLFQEDTHAEFDYKSVATTNGGNSRDLVLEPFRDISKLVVIKDPRDTLFLLVSNCFNRADELVETAIKSTNSNEIGSDLALKFLTKVRIAEYKNNDGKLVRVNFADAIKNIQILATSWGVDSSSWDEQVQSIVESQLKGMDLIRKMRNEEVKYSTQEAVEYRQNTVGKYAQLLGQVAFGKDTRKTKALYTTIMLAQFHDDCFDVLEDLNTQVNPMVAFLDSCGLTDAFTDFAKKIKVLPGATGDTIFNGFFKCIKNSDERFVYKSLFELIKTQYLSGVHNT